MRRFRLALAPVALSLFAATFAAESSGSPPLPASETKSLPVEQLAREVVRVHAPWASALELVTKETTTLDDGARIVTFDQTIDGLPVYQRGARVIVDADGRASTVNVNLEKRRPSSMVASLSPSVAIEKAGVPANDLGARLFVLPTEAGPRLVYGVVGAIPGLPTRPVVILDAHTGEVILQWDAALANKAKVYTENPVSTPTTAEVVLDNDKTKAGLESALVKALNCIDKKSVKSISIGVSLNVHVCDLLATITPNAAGDYLDILPGTGNEPEDQYAELSMYFHTSKVYDFVQKIGYPASKVKQITAVANLRVPQGMSTFDTKRMADPELKLAVFDNAFFAAHDPLFATVFGVETDAMWFGQGTLADFGYDGDVVYHEFGHFLVSQTVALGGGTVTDPYGLSYSPGALNEGIADVISLFLADDPELGEYSSKGLGTPKGKGMRSATNTFKFPDAITGEVHQDAEPFTAAIWKTYSPLDATKRVAFQKSFMKTLLTAPKGNKSFIELADLFVKDAETGVDAKTAADLRTAFDERGIKKDDPRVRAYVDGGVKSVEPRLGIHSPGKRDTTAKGDWAPGLFQIKYDAPAGGDTILHVSFKVVTRGGTFGTASGSPFGGGGTPFAPVLLAKAAEPIKFTYGPLATDAQQAACTMAADKKSATCDITVNVAGKWGETAPVHLMIANSGEQGGDFDVVTVTAEGPPEPPPAPTEDAGVTTNPATPGESSSKGCACTVPGNETTQSGAGATLALAALGLAVAARRRN